MNTENIAINTQSSIRIGGTKVLYFDPFQISTPSHDADVIFLTHDHFDHLDPESINKIIAEKTVIIAPEKMRDKLSDWDGKNKVIAVSPGVIIESMGIRIEAVPAYNRLKPFHPKSAGWTGYVVTMDETRYYVAGDTDAVKDLEEISCDIAMIPIGGKYTMNAKEAAKLIGKIKPAVVIPTHYGSIVGKKEDAQEFAAQGPSGIIVETKL